MRVVGLIPARLESSRLPEKALVDICGLPMIVHTYKRALLAQTLDDVFVATDSGRIRSVVEQHGGKVIMTSRDHKTGSDRLAEACKEIDCEIVVNIQGDEPLVNPDHIDAIVEPLLLDTSVQIAVGVTQYSKKNSPSDIKAVLDLNNDIMYCSRTDLPSDARTAVEKMLKMSFIVPFRKDFLIQYASWSPTPLEQIEYNEYLRVLEHGVKIRGVHVDDAKISVDTPDDLEEVRILMRSDSIYNLYIK
ncbi:3-deoxy-manno-octulosonate cytidylyltransferase [Methanocalculus taiwanensis]|uniref:3-deoxy-manno-octulosonate cytidylyltransferase n=1 Tax=Methanocalculus taiwanensis TaxID=106207 RepID=A0ABD4THP6_9EURY|nr:3-deoxy-manno-octulosonate cytidylyltransferase [Methanocalculus taiwanensis]MCQ1538459.1 3-deoxy-manno-octulosonate cytidylyltransferase [Methanocalculus taiwanensis]